MFSYIVYVVPYSFVNLFIRRVKIHIHVFEWPKDIKRVNANYAHMKLQSMFDIIPHAC